MPRRLLLQQAEALQGSIEPPAPLTEIEAAQALHCKETLLTAHVLKSGLPQMKMTLKHADKPHLMQPMPSTMTK